MTGKPQSSSIVRQIYIPITRSYKSNLKLSETQIKKKLEKEGWTVWRGGYLNCTRYGDVYPNVMAKYNQLAGLLGGKLEYLQYLCAVHHGMPDFLCHRKGEIKFVECKLGNETIKDNQKKCIAKLQEFQLKVEIHRFVFDSTKIRESYIDLSNGYKKITKKQSRLKLRY